MQIILVLVFMVTFLNGFDYKLKPVKVSENVTCFFGENREITKENGGHIANCCYVSTISGLVVIDSGPTYSFASQAYAVIHRLSPQKVLYVIDTHKHDDHWLANSFYKELGATIIGSKSLQNSVGKDEVTRMQRIVTPETFAKTSVVYPDIYVDKEKTLTLGKTTFKIKQLSDIAHTDGDIIVYIPNKILFAGDLVFNDRLLSLRDGDIAGWLDALDKIEALKWDKIVSGHGHITDKTALNATRNYLKDLKKEVALAMDEDVEIGDITKAVTLEKYKNLGMYKLLNKSNILKAFQILEFEEE